jgi:hypothetical protein
VYLFGEGRIDLAEYQRRIEANEREIAHWESRTAETQRAALELNMCVDLSRRLVRSGRPASMRKSSRSSACCSMRSSSIWMHSGLLTSN